MCMLKCCYRWQSLFIKKLCIFLNRAICKLCQKRGFHHALFVISKYDQNPKRKTIINLNGFTSRIQTGKRQFGSDFQLHAFQPDSSERPSWKLVEINLFYVSRVQNTEVYQSSASIAQQHIDRLTDWCVLTSKTESRFETHTHRGIEWSPSLSVSISISLNLLFCDWSSCLTPLQ